MDLCFPCSYNPEKTTTDKSDQASTGACGVSCLVCRLHVNGVCSTCGAGTSAAGKEKLAAQLRLFGKGCPILACAVERKLAYCLRDCDDFPCERFSEGPYPYSENFLEMQRRRREQAGRQSTAAWPETADSFWEKLAERPVDEVCRCAGASLNEAGLYELSSLDELWTIDPQAKTLVKTKGDFGGEWDRQMPFLILVYLALATPVKIRQKMVAPRDLHRGHNFFQGKYELHTAELEKAFGNDGSALIEAAKKLGGDIGNQADASVLLRPFPKAPVQLLLWLGDREFPAKATMLLDKGVLNHIPPDALAVTLNLMIGRLLLAGESA